MKHITMQTIVIYNNAHNSHLVLIDLNQVHGDPELINEENKDHNL